MPFEQLFFDFKLVTCVESVFNYCFARNFSKAEQKRHFRSKTDPNFDKVQSCAMLKFFWARFLAGSSNNFKDLKRLANCVTLLHYFVINF